LEVACSINITSLRDQGNVDGFEFGVAGAVQVGEAIHSGSSPELSDC
jgi:hypothetical protein